MTFGVAFGMGILFMDMLITMFSKQLNQEEYLLRYSFIFIELYKNSFHYIKKYEYIFYKYKIK